jgi:TRAP-type C4-dicarboxylate transport system permease small subunit
MSGFIRLLMRGLEYVIALCLAAMVALVFANVIARYGFDSGIVVSEEVSRYCFIWLVFLGAVVAMRDHEHLGVDSLIRRLPRLGRKFCLGISILLMLTCCWVLFVGSLHHMRTSHSNVSAVTGIPLSFVFLAGVVSSGAIGLILLGDLWMLVTGSIRDEDLVQVAEEKG